MPSCAKSSWGRLFPSVALCMLACGSDGEPIVPLPEASDGGATSDAEADAGTPDAGEGAVGPMCPAFTPRPGGCVRSSVLALANEGESRSVQLRGEVVELGTGTRAEVCGEATNVVEYGSRPQAEDAPVPWLRLRSGDGTEAVLAMWNDSWPAVSMGERLSLDARYAFVDFGPLDASLLVRRDSGGLVVASAFAGSTAALDLPAEVRMADAGIACVYEDDCWDYGTQRNLTIEVEGMAETVGPSERAQLGPYLVVGFAAHGGGQVYCEDHPGGFVGLTVSRRAQ